VIAGRTRSHALTLPSTIDFDLITAQLARVGRLNEPDRKLGLQVLAAADPTGEEGMLARTLLDRTHLDDSDIPRELDITGSMDAAFAFYERRLGLAEWSMFRMEGQYGHGKQRKLMRAEGPYHIQIELPGILCCGDGWTRPTCIVNGVLRAMLPLNVEIAQLPMVAHGEEEAALLHGLEGLIPDNPKAEGRP